MNPQENANLAAGLRALANDMESCQAPPALEPVLLEAYRRHRRGVIWRNRIIGGAIAASLICLVTSGVLLMRRTPDVLPKTPVAVATEVTTPPPVVRAAPPEPVPAPVRRAGRTRRPALQEAEVTTRFYPVMGGLLEPLDRGQLVRVQLPRSALMMFGLPMNEERASERVKADLLVGEDGMAHAIRFVQ